MKVAFLAFSLIGVMVAVTVAVPQDQEDVRGAFLTSRPKEKPSTQTAPARANRRRPKTAATVTDTGGTKHTEPSNSSSDKSTPVVVNKARIGLGLTLFTRDSNGLAVRTDPSRIFHKGDRV